MKIIDRALETQINKTRSPLRKLKIKYIKINKSIGLSHKYVKI